jgi:hypothetical protein
MSSAFHQRLDTGLLEVLTILAIPVILASILLESMYHRKLVLVIIALITLAIIF